MSPLTVENRLLIEVLATVIRSHGRHNERGFVSLNSGKRA